MSVFNALCGWGFPPGNPSHGSAIPPTTLLLQWRIHREACHAGLGAQPRISQGS